MLWRLRNEFKGWCRGALSTPKAREAMRTIVEKPRHRQYAVVVEILAAYGFGQPDQHIGVTVNPPVARFPEPVEGTDEWVSLYQPMLHQAHEA